MRRKSIRRNIKYSGAATEPDVAACPAHLHNVYTTTAVCAYWGSSLHIIRPLFKHEAGFYGTTSSVQATLTSDLQHPSPSKHQLVIWASIFRWKPSMWHCSAYHPGGCSKHKNNMKSKQGKQDILPVSDLFGSGRDVLYFWCIVGSLKLIPHFITKKQGCLEPLLVLNIATPASKQRFSS